MNNTKISFRSQFSEDPWVKAIEHFISSEFPTTHQSKESRLEAVVAEFLASRQRRLGPNPSPEAQVAIRKIALHYMEKNEPIPVLIPFGPKKPSNGLVDVAELSALKAIACLNKAVKQHYSPGMTFAIRMEDSTGDSFWRPVLRTCNRTSNDTAGSSKAWWICLDTILSSDFGANLI